MGNQHSQTPKPNANESIVHMNQIQIPYKQTKEKSEPSHCREHSEGIQFQVLPKQLKDKKETKIVTKTKQLTKHNQKHNLVLTSNYLSSITISNPIKIKILIDTGAEEVNLLSKKTFLRLKQINDKLELQRNEMIIKPLGGSIITNCGSISIPLQLNQELTTELVSFVVVERIDQHDMILGLPAIKQLSIKLEFQKGIAIIADQEFKLNINNYLKKSEIRTEEDTIIPGGKEKIVKIKVDKTIFENDKNSYHTIIPSISMTKTGSLKSPQAIAKGCLSYILISNLSEKKIKIKKNALVAHLIAKNPESNFHYVKFEDNNDKQNNEKNEEIITEEELLGDKIYIPESNKEKIQITEEDLRENLFPQSQHLKQIKVNKLFNLIQNYKGLFSTNNSSPGVQTKTKMHVEIKEGTVL